MEYNEREAGMGEYLYYRPPDLQELLRVKSRLGRQGILLAGGTNVMVYVKDGTISAGTLVDIASLPELKGVRQQNGCIEIGAGEVMADLLENPLLQSRLPVFVSMLRCFANPLVRNRATLGGNLADASPIGDSIPVLLTLGARMRVAGDGGERTVSLEQFFSGPGENTLQPEELIRTVEVPLPESGRGSFQKLGLRKGSSCSVVSVAVWLVAEGGKVREIAIACGGVAPTPLRARRAEKAFRGQPLEPERVRALAEEVQPDIRPISDVRGSAEYRRRVTAALLARAVRQAAGLEEGERP